MDRDADQNFNCQVFPRVTKCTFHKYGPSGGIQRCDQLSKIIIINYQLTIINNTYQLSTIDHTYQLSIINYQSYLSIIKYEPSGGIQRWSASFSKPFIFVVWTDALEKMTNGISILLWLSSKHHQLLFLSLIVCFYCHFSQARHPVRPPHQHNQWEDLCLPMVRTHPSLLSLTPCSSPGSGSASSRCWPSLTSATTSSWSPSEGSVGSSSTESSTHVQSLKWVLQTKV